MRGKSRGGGEGKGERAGGRKGDGEDSHQKNPHHPRDISNASAFSSESFRKLNLLTRHLATERQL